MSHDDTIDLWRRFRSMDAEATGKLYEMHGPELRSFLRRHGATPEDVDDLVQNVFLKVLMKDVRPEAGTLRGYLFVAAKNEWRQQWRRRNKLSDWRRRARAEAAATPPPLVPEQSILEIHEIVRQVYENDFTSYQCDVFRRVYSGWTVTQIAIDLGRSEPAVRQQRYLIRKKVRSRLDPEAPSGEREGSK